MRYRYCLVTDTESKEFGKMVNTWNFHIVRRSILCGRDHNVLTELSFAGYSSK